MGVRRVRGFVRGVFWGGVSGIAGLAVVSQLAGSVALQGPSAPQDVVGLSQLEDAASAPPEVKAPQDDWEKIAPIPMPPTRAEKSSAADKGASVTPAPDEPDTVAIADKPAEDAADKADKALAAPKGQGDVAQSAVAVAPIPTPAQSVPVEPSQQPDASAGASVTGQAAAVAPLTAPPASLSPVEGQSTKSASPALTQGAALSPATDAAKTEAVATDTVQTGTAKTDSAKTDTAKTETVETPTPKDAPVTLDSAAPLSPSPTAGDTSGIGGDIAPPAASPALAAGSPLPTSPRDASEDISSPVALPTGGALQRFSRSFSNLEQKPLFSILLVDEGGQGVDRAALAAQDVPLTIVIDPSKPEALAQAKIWRDGGQEVVLSGAGLPAGVSGAAYGAALKALADGLPEAVALVDLDGRTFQNDLGMVAEIVPFLAQSGRGLMTLDQGANPADQSAKREGLPHGRIFRKLDVDRETADVVARYLDRAAFKAAQEGRVAVLGHVRPDTIAGIMQWAVEGRAASVALAPVSALLSK